MMHALLDAVFSLFGKKALGQVIGATLVGAMVVVFHFLWTTERPPVGELSTWVIGGASAGFTEGLILVSPRVFFETLFGLLCLLVIIVPMSHADGTPATSSEHAITVAIGAAFTVLSIS